MTITSITPRKDGKFLVGLHFSHGTNLRKLMTPEALAKTKAQIAADRTPPRQHDPFEPRDYNDLPDCQTMRDFG